MCFERDAWGEITYFSWDPTKKLKDQMSKVDKNNKTRWSANALISLTVTLHAGQLMVERLVLLDSRRFLPRRSTPPSTALSFTLSLPLTVSLSWLMVVFPLALTMEWSSSLASLQPSPRSWRALMKSSRSFPGPSTEASSTGTTPPECQRVRDSRAFSMFQPSRSQDFFVKGKEDRMDNIFISMKKIKKNKKKVSQLLIFSQIKQSRMITAKSEGIAE